MINKSLKSIVFAFFFVSIIITTIACKKDRLEIDIEKSFYQADHTPQHQYDGGWQLTLHPNQTADIAPGGDIIFGGSYTLKGSKIKVKVAAFSEQFEFEVISKTEIKETKSGVRLILSANND